MTEDTNGVDHEISMEEMYGMPKSLYRWTCSCARHGKWNMDVARAYSLGYKHEKRK